MSKIDWLNISYLQTGNQQQQDAYSALQSLQIFEILRQHSPVLVGTIPIDLAINGSDLDIICHVQDTSIFSELVKSSFERHENFVFKHSVSRGENCTVINFDYSGFPIEIFAQDIPTVEQNAYRHMLVEHRLLTLAGIDARNAILDLKRNSMKTEPAFAQYFRLTGDSYETLRQLSYESDDVLEKIILNIQD